MTIRGTHHKGQGRGHLAMEAHDAVFGQRMIGTFNVKTRKSIEEFVPAMEFGGFRYWMVLVDGTIHAWAIRREGTEMPPTLWEIISREALPVALRERRFDLEVVEDAFA